MGNSPILKWRIATTEVGLARGSFLVRNIPPVSASPYQPFSKITPRSDGGDATHGYKKLTLMWDVMKLEQYYRIKKLVEESRPGLLYITFELNDGSVAGGFADASGRPQFMQAAGEVPAARTGDSGVRNVVLTLNNVTLVNNPSSYS